MVQVLPYVPSFLEQISPHVAQSIGQGVSAWKQKSALTGLQALLNQGKESGTGATAGEAPFQLSASNVIPTYQLAKGALGKDTANVLLNTLANEQKAVTKEQAQIRTEQRAKANQSLEAATVSKEQLIGQQASLAAAEQAVHAGKSEGVLSGDFWANQLGLPELKGVSGSVLEGAAKTHLLTSLGNLSGGRPNQFLEKQISQAFALPGGSKAANLAKLEILKSLADMKQLQVDETLKIAEAYEEQGKPVPGNVSRLALKKITPEIERRQKQSSYKLQNLLEPPEGSPALDKVEKVPPGTPLTEKKAAVIFKKANPGAFPQTATEEQFEKAYKLAKGLGYDPDLYSTVGE